MTQKLTRNQRDHLRQLVQESQLKRLTAMEGVQYVNQKLGIPIGVEYYNKIKGDIKKNVGKRIEILQKDRYAYHAKFFERIDELKSYQKDLHEIIKKNSDKPHIQRACMTELRELTISLSNLYLLFPDLLPVQFVNDSHIIIKREKEDSIPFKSEEAKF